MNLMIANKMRLIAKSFATASSGLIFRPATVKDVDIFTRRTISEGWHVRPYDYPCAYAFDPEGFFIGEVDGELASHACAVRYPNHHAHIGGTVVTHKFRGKGFAIRSVWKAVDECNPNYTIGADVFINLSHIVATRIGFETHWDSYLATFSLDKISKVYDKMAFPTGVVVKSISKTNLEKLLKYDCNVFGVARHILVERWISVPGSHGWAAISEKNNNIVGYAIVKQVIRGAGTEIGLAIAPLFADDAQIAKALLKTAADSCLANEAVPKTKLEMFHPVGDNCGEGAPQMMEELEAELSCVAHRLYTKGVPPRRQLKKIYGIGSYTFD